MPFVIAHVIVVGLIRINRAMISKMRHNLIWAAALHVISISLAVDVGVLQAADIVMQLERDALVIYSGTIIHHHGL